MDEPNCESGVQGKQTNAAAKSKLVSHAQSTKIHSDMCGPLDTATLSGNCYILEKTTNPLLYTVLEVIKTKNKTAQLIYDFITSINRNSDTKQKRIYMDFSKEILVMYRSFIRQGLTYTTSSAH